MSPSINNQKNQQLRTLAEETNEDEFNGLNQSEPNIGGVTDLLDDMGLDDID
jgi:hypothetical protein